MHKPLCGSARRVVLKTSVFDGCQQCVRRPSNDGYDGRQQRCWRPPHNDLYGRKGDSSACNRSEKIPKWPNVIGRTCPLIGGYIPPKLGGWGVWTTMYAPPKLGGWGSEQPYSTIQSNENTREKLSIIQPRQEKSNALHAWKACRALRRLVRLEEISATVQTPSPLT